MKDCVRLDDVDHIWIFQISSCLLIFQLALFRSQIQFTRGRWGYLGELGELSVYLKIVFIDHFLLEKICRCSHFAKGRSVLTLLLQQMVLQCHKSLQMVWWMPKVTLFSYKMSGSRNFWRSSTKNVTIVHF